jgi:hypothetical protein
MDDRMRIHAASIAAPLLLAASACSSNRETSGPEAGTDGGPPSCVIDSDAGVGVTGPPYCYPESTKPSGPCTSGAPTCTFCGYLPCPVPSGLIEPHTFYECSCAAGSWSCRALSQFGDACAPVLSCLGPDGGLAVVCLSGAGVSCTMFDGGAGPVCALAGGVTPIPCGLDSCFGGCTCPDPSTSTCACQ